MCPVVNWLSRTVTAAAAPSRVMSRMLTVRRLSSGQNSPARWYIPLGLPSASRKGASRQISTSLWTSQKVVGSSPLTKVMLMIRPPSPVRASCLQASVAWRPLSAQMGTVTVPAEGVGKLLSSRPSWMALMTFFQVTADCCWRPEDMRSGWSKPLQTAAV